MVLFDTSIVAIAFDKNAAAPLDPNTRFPVAKCKERIDYLIASLAAQKERILIPTPVVAEYIVSGGPDKEKRLDVIVNSKAFVVAPFDLRAAIECALLEDADTAKGKKLDATTTKAKVKFDRQIIATAIARGAATIYTGDEKLAARAKDNGLSAVLTWELPLPPQDPQLKLIDPDEPTDSPDEAAAA